MLQGHCPAMREGCIGRQNQEYEETSVYAIGYEAKKIVSSTLIFGADSPRFGLFEHLVRDCPEGRLFQFLVLDVRGDKQDGVGSNLIDASSGESGVMGGLHSTSTLRFNASMDRVRTQPTKSPGSAPVARSMTWRRMPEFRATFVRW